MDFEQRLLERSEMLTPTERRLAESLLAAPQLVAFGTVAEFAAAARSGTATVVRFATKLGYDGYSDLQASVQRDLTGRLRPAVERIRDEMPTDVDGLVDRHADIEAPTCGRRSTRSTATSRGRSSPASPTSPRCAHPVRCGVSGCRHPVPR